MTHPWQPLPWLPAVRDCDGSCTGQRGSTARLEIVVQCLRPAIALFIALACSMLLLACTRKEPEQVCLLGQPCPPVAFGVFGDESAVGVPQLHVDHIINN